MVEWISDVDGVIELFTQFEDTPQHKLIVRTIRRKVVGEANQVLVNSSTNLCWKNIRETLILQYSDKRDLMTLTVQLVMLTRKNESIESFYAKIQEIQSLLTYCIQLDTSYIGYEVGILKLYSNICLETFIREIGAMSPFLKNYKPKSLSQAYQYALEFENTSFRSKIQMPLPIPLVNQYQHFNNPIQDIRPRFSNFQNRPSPQFNNKNYNSSWRQPEPRKMAHVAQTDVNSHNNDHYQSNETDFYGNFRQNLEMNNLT